MQKKQKVFSRPGGANPQALACEPATLTIRLGASHGIAAVETACNRELCDTIAQFGHMKALPSDWPSITRS